MLSREYVHDVLTDGGYYQLLSDEIIGAQSDWYSLLASNPEIMGGAIPREKSVFLNRRAVERICGVLEGQPKVAISHKYWSSLVIINNEILLRFKSLNNGFRTSNIKTRCVEKLWFENQRLGGAFDQWINVAFGWQFDRTGMISELAVVNEFGDRLEWIIRLVDGGIGQVSQEQTQFTVANNKDETPVFVVKVRNSKRAQEIADDQNKDANGSS